jgi:hypothetical protein
MRRMAVIGMLALCGLGCSAVLDFKPKERDAAMDVAPDAADVVGDTGDDEVAQDVADGEGVEAPDAAGPKSTVLFMSAGGGAAENAQYKVYGSIRANDCGPASNSSYTLKSCSVDILNH